MLQVCRSSLRRQSGFSLIELMIAVVIVGVLAKFAVPSYLDHIRKGRRADAQQYMMTLAQANQQYFLDNRAYTNNVASLATTPASVSTYYTVSITVSAGPPPTYTVSAVPTGAQTSDSCGTLSLTNAGTKSSSSGSNCW